MAIQRTNLDPDTPKPEREGTNREWTSNMDMAAQCRALGMTNQETADQLDLAVQTVEGYKYDNENFSDLVDWYRNQMWQESLEEYLEDLWPEALDSLKDVIENRPGQSDNPDIQTPNWNTVVKASKSILKMTGFEQSQKTRRELETQEQITGTPGDQLTVTQRKFEEMDDEELDEKIEQLEVVSSSDDEDEDAA